MKNLYRVFSISIFLIVVFILFIIIYTLIYRAFSLESIPKLFNYGYCAIISDSMESEISIGDLVIIKKCDNYIIGDIVTYRIDDKLITHRIINKEEGFVFTKGDNNRYIDEKVNINFVEGKCIKVIPKLGAILLTLKKPISIIIISILLFLKLEISNYINNNSKV